MKVENKKETDDVVFYGQVEEGVIKILEHPLRCLEEEYEAEFILADKEDGKCLGIDYAGRGAGRKHAVDMVMQSLLPALLSYGQHQYLERQMLEKEHMSPKEDSLTGVFAEEYLIDRASVLNRAELYPTTVIAVKLKYWKSVVENYGRESGDSLLQLAASILSSEADKDYLIGRMAEDVFVVLIPLVKQGEAESYCKCVNDECGLYKDSDFSPVLEMGITATQTRKDDVIEKIREAMAQLPQD